jgi:NAD(P)-dependent dehydrogenase (short-subunit alcohol dehydrogenase family)
MTTIFDLFRLDGKRSLITGGSRGLGRAMVQALAEAGADLVLVGRDTENLQKVNEELKPLGRRVDLVNADLTSPAATETMCQKVLAEFAPVDILINNVGGRREDIPLESQSIADWSRLMDLNLTSAFVCTKMIGAAMLPRGWGRVINIGSMCGQIAGRNIRGRHYETAKAALAGFTRAVAADWAPHGVTVNCIAPGGFMTDANRRWFKERPALKQEIEAFIPMGRLGEPHEIAPLALYLASEASSYMTGSVVLIDGGYTLW